MEVNAMISRAQTLTVIAALAALVGLAWVSPAAARPSAPERPRAALEARQVAGLRHSIAWHRSRTWELQDRIGAPRTPSSHAERRTRSVPFLLWVDRLWNHRQKVARRRLAQISASSPAAVPRTICQVFGSRLCPEALHIAYGESRYEIWVANGQYLGLFQMGSGERAMYATIGYSTAYEQIIAARNLYDARGWEPWTCCGE